MTDVGVRELKQHLSEYLERAERGERVTVTDRGRPKAMLVPLPGRERVSEGIEAGWITGASGGPLARRSRWPGRVAVRDSLSEDRDG